MRDNSLSLKNTGWGDFLLSDIFAIEIGERLTKTNRIEGNIPLITASSYCNGITAFIDEATFIETKKLFERKITVDMFGNVFYHKYKYFSDDNVHTLIIKDDKDLRLNDYIYMFMVTILRKMSSKYDFGRQLRLHRLEREIVSLPTDKHKKPNWKFMLEYTYSKSRDIIYNKPLSYPKNSIPLDSVQWKEFKVGDLFEVVGTRTTPLKELKDYGDGKCPYITTKATNNGVDGFYDHYTEAGNVLTIDSATIGHTTYQQSNFSASDHVEKLIPKFAMNRYVALFLKTILNREKYRYDYGRKFNQKRIKATVIKLPAKSNQPDWQFIENYMKSLPYSSNLI